jgi:16S rRNA (guanine527-N7)-methyltransferase
VLHQVSTIGTRTSSRAQHLRRLAKNDAMLRDIATCPNRPGPMPQLSNAEIKCLLGPYGVDASDHLCNQIRIYTELLLGWNRRISLTTVTDPAQVVRFHFGESMFAASAVPIRNGRLADVGAGPGFPSIPLSMASDGLIAVPIESSSKKSTFMSEVARRLGLACVHPFRGRMEDFPLSEADFDWVIARALGTHRDLANWAQQALSPSGSLVLWLGESDASEISKLSGWTWRSPIKIPDSDRRVLLVGELSHESNRST